MPRRSAAPPTCCATRAGVPQQAQPHAGRVPGPGAVPDLHRDRRGGGVRRADPAGSDDPAKYKNSSETPIYAKSKTLYGLNWAKADIVDADQVIVCEGYTDVIGFHRAGVPRAVATCGTALTEEHVRLLKRYASRVVLAFDADAAGQGAAERVLRVGAEVPGRGVRWPGSRRARTRASWPSPIPTRWRAPSTTRCRSSGSALDRVLNGRRRSRRRSGPGSAEQAMAVVNEHPNVERAQALRRRGGRHGGPAGRRPRADRRARRRAVRRSRWRRKRSRRSEENAEFVALVLLVQHWDEIAPWLIEELFDDDANRRAFLALAEAGGDLAAALELADPEAREVLERAAVADLDVQPDVEARNLIARRGATRADRARTARAIPRRSTRTVRPGSHSSARRPDRTRPLRRPSRC